jgi:hypothetical protein
MLLREAWLNSSESLESFKREFERRSGLKTIESYLYQGKVRVFIDKQGKMRGGYLLNYTSPHRLISVIPENHLTTALTILDKENLEVTDLVEVIYFWIDTINLSNLSRLQIYLRSILDCLATGKKAVLGGALTEGTMKTQMAGLPILIYSGPLKHLNKKICWIYIGRSRQLITKWVIYGFKTFYKVSYFKIKRFVNSFERRNFNPSLKRK